MSLINNLEKAGFLEYPLRYLIWVTQLAPSVFNWPLLYLQYSQLIVMLSR